MYYVIGRSIVQEMAANLWEQGVSFRVLAIQGTSEVVAVDELRCAAGHVLIAESVRTDTGGLTLTGALTCPCGDWEWANAEDKESAEEAAQSAGPH